MLDHLLNQLHDQDGADGVLCAPLRRQDAWAHVYAAVNGPIVIGDPIYVSPDESVVRVATMQEIHDTRLDRPDPTRYDPQEEAE